MLLIFFLCILLIYIKYVIAGLLSRQLFCLIVIIRGDMFSFFLFYIFSGFILSR